MKILVTGGAGFIGSAVIRYLLSRTQHTVVNVDKLTYAADLRSLDEVAVDPRYVFEKLDICDGAGLAAMFAKHRPDAVMHLAAESHVDRSIDMADIFIQTNLVGTFRLLECARAHWSTLDAKSRQTFRFLHVSTDEVFGALEAGDPPFSEMTRYDPRSPYSASKAGSDHLVRAWYHTYGLPTLVTNCTNNYGPYHFPEKLIPLTIIRALLGEPLLIYGKGENIRDWLFVEDHAAALELVLTRGRLGETYCIGGHAERTNLQVVEVICDILDQTAPPLSGGRLRRSLITHVEDRPGHDFRYAMNTSNTQAELGWEPSLTFDVGIRKTIAWFMENRNWWEPALARYGGRRLGTIAR